MRQLIYTAILFGISVSCGLQSSSEHAGGYSFSSSSDVVDSSLYPLSHLIIVEENGLTNQTLVYLFSGQLAGANLGFEDFNNLVDRWSTSQYPVQAAT